MRMTLQRWLTVIYKYLINKEYFLYSKTNCTNFYLDKKFKNDLNDILNTRNNNSL